MRSIRHQSFLGGGAGEPFFSKKGSPAYILSAPFFSRAPYFTFFVGEYLLAQVSWINMNDPRYTQLAQVLARFSTRLKRGDNVLIDAYDIPEEMVGALQRAAKECGANAFVQLNSARVMRQWVREASDKAFVAQARVELARIKLMDAYIAVRGGHNIFESSDVPAERAKAWMKALRPALNWRVNKTRWVVLRWPTPAFAQLSRKSTEQFEDFFFKVCTLDYARMIPGMRAMKALMEKTDRVRIKAPGVDLEFSIKGMSAIPCGGQMNIPDGEIFTAPVRESVQGVVTFNSPTIYQGASFDKIRLVFEKGKVVEATAQGDVKRLNAILDSDAGARYVGEFALGFNPHITEPMRDILFDEKIAGSFHMALGQAYEEADNGNRSQVHWDLVSIQRPEMGGGEIYFDGKLVRKNGRFIPKALQKLNPEYLLKGKRK